MTATTTPPRQPIEIADIERLVAAEAPDIADLIKAFLAQYSDDEEEYDDDGEEIPKQREEVPEGTITLTVLKTQLVQAAKKREKKQRQVEAYDAWKRYLAQDPKLLAPQLKLADIIVALYDKRASGPARAALLAVIRDAPLAFGVWGGLKRVMKRAETDFDAEIFGALAARIDVSANDRGDVSRGTQIYMRRRAWRYLRDLGKSTPELYPQFCVEVLRRYPPDTGRYLAWVGNRIASHSAKKWGGWKPERNKKFRAPYIEAWKRAPDPLLLLLETCECDFAAELAIDGLKELFPDVLRNVKPEWLARLTTRPLEAAHDFVIETLEASPELHQGKLKALGLHDAVLGLLTSPSAKARKYAIEYARAHATDLSAERLADLLASDYAETVKFAAAMLTARKPRELGAQMLGRLLRYEASRKWAAGALESDFDKKDISLDLLADLVLSDDDEQSDWVQKFIKKKFQPRELEPSFWIRILDDKRFRDYEAYDTDYPLEQLLEHPIASIPSDWLLESLARSDIGSEILEHLQKADSLPPGLDVEKLKGMVFDSRKRGPVLEVLGNVKLVQPQALHEWAHRYLLQHMKPEHFAEGKADGAAGTARLFQLAIGPKEPEAVRAFAQTYLRCHHPTLSREQPETKQFGIKPALARTAFTMELLWPALWDLRPDVRKFAATVARVELRKWNAQNRVYELGESPAKEVRNIAYDALMQAGEADAQPELALTLDELDAAQIFSMTESRKRSTRDVAMELIRKHYKRIGGAERLGWLMQSADREVRLFAVRLLWEKHRPRSIPHGWQPQKGVVDLGDESFADVQALRKLLRLLFMVPPLRSAESVEKQRARKLPASLAKKHVIEIVRDFGMTDAAFAALVAPVLAEFTGSMAKGEWSACLAALVGFRSAHGLAIEGMV
jgi:hypothetical protein